MKFSRSPAYFNGLPGLDWRGTAGAAAGAEKRKIRAVCRSQRVSPFHQIAATRFNVFFISAHLGDGDLIPGKKSTGSQFMRNNIRKLRIDWFIGAISAQAGEVDQEHGYESRGKD